jgi:hypothetical protein
MLPFRQFAAVTGDSTEILGVIRLSAWQTADPRETPAGEIWSWSGEAEIEAAELLIGKGNRRLYVVDTEAELEAESGSGDAGSPSRSPRCGAPRLPAPRRAAPDRGAGILMSRVTITAKITTRLRDFFGGRRAGRIMLREFQTELGPRLVRVGRQTAPYAHGGLARGLRHRVGRGLSLELESTVRSKEGFPYTGVTRFGRGPIVPKNKKALAFSIGGKAVVVKRVRGWKPAGDWAEGTQRAAQPHIARSARRIGRQLQGVSA